MSSNNNGRPSTNANQLTVTCKEIQSIQPYVRHPAPFLCETGQIVRLMGYDIDQVLCCLLEDYGEEVILNKIKSL